MSDFAGLPQWRNRTPKPPRARCDCGRLHERFEAQPGVWVTGCLQCFAKEESRASMAAMIAVARAYAKGLVDTPSERAL